MFPPQLTVADAMSGNIESQSRSKKISPTFQVGIPTSLGIPVDDYKWNASQIFIKGSLQGYGSLLQNLGMLIKPKRSYKMNNFVKFKPIFKFYLLSSISYISKQLV